MYRLQAHIIDNYPYIVLTVTFLRKRQETLIYVVSVVLIQVMCRVSLGFPLVGIIQAPGIMLMSKSQ